MSIVLQIFLTRNYKYFYSFPRKNGSFISCWGPHRFEQRPHGGRHQFCGKMYCDSCEYIIFHYIIIAETCFSLPSLVTYFWETVPEFESVFKFPTKEGQTLKEIVNICLLFDRLCGLVVMDPGNGSRGLGLISGATTFLRKYWVWNGVHPNSWVRFKSYLEEKIAAPVKKTEITVVGICCADHATPSILKKLAPTSPTSGSRLVGIVHSWTKGMELLLLLCLLFSFYKLIICAILYHKI
jgi:hypothetical protein